MNYTDIDIDIAGMLECLAENHVVFYFRACPDEEHDFLYAKGDLHDMGETLSNLMNQNEDLANMVSHAAAIYNDSE